MREMRLTIKAGRKQPNIQIPQTMITSTASSDDNLGGEDMLAIEIENHIQTPASEIGPKLAALFNL